MRRALFTTFLLVVALVLGACLPDPLEAITSDDLFRFCGELRFDGPVDEELVLEPISAEVKEILDAEIERIGADSVATDVVQWYVVSQSDDEIGITHKRPNGDADSYTQGHLRLTDEGWRGGGWGPCEIRFGAPDRRYLTWELDNSFDPTDSLVHVTAREGRCGSDSPIDPANIQPVVVPTPERVTVLLVAPQSDDDGWSSFCQAPIEQKIEVDLGEPLGDRELHDGVGVSSPISSLRYPTSEATG